MHSVGACRQCAVKQFKDEHDTKGRIVMACMTPVEDGMRISIDDPEAKRFRAGVIEWLMTNHPHDCPVCDEGGECHLQDMTVMTGHVVPQVSRFKKRTYRSQDLGAFRHPRDEPLHRVLPVRRGFTTTTREATISALLPPATVSFSVAPRTARWKAPLR